MGKPDERALIVRYNRTKYWQRRFAKDAEELDMAREETGVDSKMLQVMKDAAASMAESLAEDARKLKLQVSGKEDSQ